MVELVKKEDVKSKQMTLSEKKLVASVTKEPPRQIIDNTGGASAGGGASGVKTNVSATVNGTRVGVDNATNLNVVPPDTDIKQMLDQLQQGQGGLGGVGGFPAGGQAQGDGTGVLGSPGAVVETKFPPLSVNIVKGMLYTVYMLPSYVYRVEYHPDEFVLNIKAQQLTDLMARYGITDVKYIDMLFFVGGVMGDVSAAFGVCREKRDDLNRKKKHDELLEERDEQMRVSSGSGMIDTMDNSALTKVSTASVEKNSKGGK